MIYIPESFQKKIQIENLYINTQKNVMNLDIIPTVIELFQNHVDNQNKTVKLSGESLLGKMSSDRTIIISNNNETSIYKVGVSFIRNDLHYILKINSIPKKEELYNIKQDPFESKNLWLEQSKEKKAEIRGKFNGCKVCVELFSSLNTD
jgi:hypothetical protein